MRSDDDVKSINKAINLTLFAFYVFVLRGNQMRIALFSVFCDRSLDLPNVICDEMIETECESLTAYPEHL